jgi:hypothetical protein
VSDECVFCGGRPRHVGSVRWRGEFRLCCLSACAERLVAAELQREADVGVPCARTYIIVHRTGLTPERVTAALQVLKARGLAVEDEALDQVWGWKLAEVAS